MPSKTLQDFQDRISYQFIDRDLLVRAMTHSSAGTDHYERLEFLGDRVLSLVMADILFHAFPNESEGGIAKRHAALVSGDTLAEIALEILIQDVVRVPEKERSLGATLQGNLLSDALEALIGAVYLDSGLEACRKLIARLWDQRPHTMTAPPPDPKTELQEWAQARGLPVPVYEISKREGPDHAPAFEVTASVDGWPSVIGKGSSKRSAEKRAAAALLSAIRSEQS